MVALAFLIPKLWSSLSKTPSKPRGVVAKKWGIGVTLMEFLHLVNLQLQGLFFYLHPVDTHLPRTALAGVAGVSGSRPLAGSLLSLQVYLGKYLARW